MAGKEYVMKSLFRTKPWLSLFLVKLKGYPINDSERFREAVNDGICFWFQAVTVCF